MPEILQKAIMCHYNLFYIALWSLNKNIAPNSHKILKYNMAKVDKLA